MADQPDSEPKEKSLYLLQIQYLDEQLNRCQLRCEELEEQKKHLTSRYAVLDKEKKDVIEVLKSAEAVKVRRVEELKEQLERQHQAGQQVQEALELEHRQEMEKMEDQVELLNLKNRLQVAKTQDLKQQTKLLMQQLIEAEALKKQLLSQREKHEADIRSLKVAAMPNTEKLREVVQDRVDQCVQEKIADVLMVERSQHGMLMEQQQALLREKELLTREMEMLQESDAELCAKSDDLEKELETAKLKTFEQKKLLWKLCHELKGLRVKLRAWTIADVGDQMEARRDEMAAVSEALCQTAAEADQLEAELEKERSRTQQLTGVKQEAAIILRHILMDSLKPSETQWRKRRLLEILESVAPQGAASETSSGGQKPQTSGPKPASSISPSAGASTSTTCWSKPSQL